MARCGRYPPSVQSSRTARGARIERSKPHIREDIVVAAPVELDGKVLHLVVSLRRTDDGTYQYNFTFDNGSGGPGNGARLAVDRTVHGSREGTARASTYSSTPEISNRPLRWPLWRAGIRSRGTVVGGEPRSKAATGRQTTDGLKGAVAQVVNESVAITRSGSARLEHAVFGIGRPRRSARR